MCLDRVRPPRRYEEVYMGDRARTYFLGCQVKSYTDPLVHRPSDTRTPTANFTQDIHKQGRIY